jgi:hypothetical protein
VNGPRACAHRAPPAPFTFNFTITQSNGTEGR